MTEIKNRTVLALMGRGIDQAKAEKLKNNGYTLGKLKSLSNEEMLAIGLSETEILVLKDGARPPIPNETLHKLLFENRWACCVCRDGSKPIIVHHIKPWAKSKTHNIENLCVLCLEHHDKAHQKGGLSLNLDETRLKEAKASWKEEVIRLDTRSILDCERHEGTDWLYFNQLRLFELAKQLGINLSDLTNFEKAKFRDVCEDNGLLVLCNTHEIYFNSGEHTMLRYQYLSELLWEIIRQKRVTNFSDHISKSITYTALDIGDMIFLQGKHSFLRLGKKQAGQGQICNAKRKVDGVEFRFSFDLWEATSVSAYATWLTGTKSVGSILLIRNRCRENGTIILDCTCLAIGYGFDDLKNKEYYVPNFRINKHLVEEADDNELDDDIFEELFNDED